MKKIFFKNQKKFQPPKKNRKKISKNTPLKKINKKNHPQKKFQKMFPKKFTYFMATPKACLNK